MPETAMPDTYVTGALLPLHPLTLFVMLVTIALMALSVRRLVRSGTSEWPRAASRRATAQLVRPDTYATPRKACLKNVQKAFIVH